MSNSPDGTSAGNSRWLDVWVAEMQMNAPIRVQSLMLTSAENIAKPLLNGVQRVRAQIIEERRC